MHHRDEELRQAVALFRYGLIADVLRLPPGSREIRRTLNEKSQRTYTIPGTRRTRVAVETMRDWLSLYRTGGFEALYPKTRTDRGRPRRMPPEVAELLVSLKTERPALSVKALIEAARERGADHPLAPSTVHRLLSREGLLDKRPGEPVATDRRRFAFRYAGELWMSDVMHGPKVSDGRRRRKTFLIAFIDDATRVIPFAAFAHSENTTTFLPVFKHAIARRGLPARLYVDNGANFRSQQLALVCAKLGIALIHARPYQPAGKGKDRALLPNPSRRLARPPWHRGHREPRHVEPHLVGLGRGRVPPIAPSRPRRAHPPGPMGARGRERALPRPDHRS